MLHLQKTPPLKQNSGEMRTLRSISRSKQPPLLPHLCVAVWTALCVALGVGATLWLTSERNLWLHGDLRVMSEELRNANVRLSDVVRTVNEIDTKITNYDHH